MKTLVCLSVLVMYVGAAAATSYWVCYAPEGSTDLDTDVCSGCSPCTNTQERPPEECRRCKQCDVKPSEVDDNDFTYCVERIDLPPTGPPPPPDVNYDPHFMITSINSDETLCFDYYGVAGQILNLIEDDESDTLVEAQLHQWNEEKKHATVFSKIFIDIGGVDMEFGFDDIQVEDKLLPWSLASPVVIGDVIISPSDHHDVIDIHNTVTDVILSVTRHEAPTMGTYLGVFVRDKGSMSRDTTGMMGQFFFAELKMLGQRMMVNLPNDATKDIPVSMTQRHSYGIHHDVECWHYNVMDDEAYVDGMTLNFDPRQGDSLLGLYEQYIVGQADEE